MSKYVIQAIKFTGGYPGTTVLHNLHWNVEEHEWVEIRGANNSGKSSLIHALYGELPERLGQLSVLDYAMVSLNKNDQSALRRRLGYAAQQPNLLKNKTIRANLSMALTAADRIQEQSNDQAISVILQRIGLQDKMRMELGQLSYSDQLLVALARAVVHRPKLLLLDQTLDAFDEARRELAIRLIQEMREADRMTVISTSLTGFYHQISHCKSALLADGTVQFPGN